MLSIFKKTLHSLGQTSPWPKIIDFCWSEQYNKETRKKNYLNLKSTLTYSQTITLRDNKFLILVKWNVKLVYAGLFI